MVIPLLFLPPSVDTHLGCFHLLTVMKNVAMNICVQVFTWTSVSKPLGSTPRSGIVMSCDDHMFDISRNIKVFSKVAAPCDVPMSTVCPLQLMLRVSVAQFSDSRKIWCVCQGGGCSNHIIPFPLDTLTQLILILFV